MHPIIINFYGEKKVIFSKHAKDRLIQRFKLFLLQHERENPLFFLEKDFKNSVIAPNKYMSSGFVNSRDSKYGKNSFACKSEHLIYFGNYNEITNEFFIKTIVSTKRCSKLVEQIYF